MAVVELRGVAILLRTTACTDGSGAGGKGGAAVRAAVKGGGNHYPSAAAACAAASTLADAAVDLASQIDAGLQRWGVVRHGESGQRVYAMEVDGYGNSFFGDDANVPSLLSLPYLGYLPSSDPIYRATRLLLLDPDTNPYYYGAKYTARRGGGGQGGGGIGGGGGNGGGGGGDGVGLLGGVGSEDASGQAGLGYVWPLSLAVRLLTLGGGNGTARGGGSGQGGIQGGVKGGQGGNDDDDEARAVLATLREASGGTGLMHESFWYADPQRYTRGWFAMANSAFAEAILTIAETRPHLLFKAAG